MNIQSYSSSLSTTPAPALEAGPNSAGITTTPPDPVTNSISTVIASCPGLLTTQRLQARPCVDLSNSLGLNLDTMKTQSRAVKSIRMEGEAEAELIHLNSEIIDLAKTIITLDKDGKAKTRSSGLRASLELYERNLKQEQPELHTIANAAVDQFEPYKQIPKMICVITARSDEARLSQLLQQLSQQTINKSDLSIYLFLNGPDADGIETKYQEINDTMQAYPGLDLRIIKSTIPQGKWANGLKTIASTTATLSVLKTLNQLGLADHQDIAIHGFDADIIRPKPELLQERLAKLQSGTTLVTGDYKVDLAALIEDGKNNINVGILQQIFAKKYELQRTLSNKFCQAAGWQQSAERSLSYLLLGGNYCCSLALIALAQGIPIHAHPYEDAAISDRTKAVLATVFPQLTKQQDFIDAHLIPIPPKPGDTSEDLPNDGGAELRALMSDLPVSMRYSSYDKTQIKPEHQLPAIKWEEPSLINLKRIQKEITHDLEVHINTLYSSHKKQAESGEEPKPSDPKQYLEEYLPKLESTIKTILQPHGLDVDFRLEASYPLGNGFPNVRVYFKDQAPTIVAQEVPKQTPAQS